MTKNPKWVKALKDLANERRSLADVMTEVMTPPFHDDRTAAILCSTKVEDGLLDLLKFHLRPADSKDDDNRLFGPTSPLGAHGTRIALCYRMRLIGQKTLDDLEAIRLIRNAFAHSRKSIWFTTPAIAEGCQRLTIVDRTSDLEGFAPLQSQSIDTPRERFERAAYLYELGFLQRGAPGLTNALPEVPLD